MSMTPVALIASALIVLRSSFRALTYRCANVLLHLVQMPRRFVGSCPPPASSGMMWSTCVDGIRLQTVHTGCSCKTTPLFFKYSGLWCAFAIPTPPVFASAR